MGQNTLNCREAQEQRLKIKTLSQQMKNLAVDGTGISPWEAQILIDTIEEVYFNDPELKQSKHGQLKYSCVSATEPAGKPIADCQMVTVALTLFADEDDQDLSRTEKDASIEKRQRRVLRITEEAREAGGLLTQEDLAKILMCDIRTVRRDIKDLRELAIVVPTRGTVKDIGPGVSHRALAVRLWLEGKEPSEVATHIKHSIKAVENYLEKFKRVAYLKRKGFTEFEISRTIGMSVSAAKTFIDIFKEFKHKAFFKSRMSEIELVGALHYQAQDEKKESPTLKTSTNAKQVNQ
jgi:DNA-binding CsgD family transcriptional regulator